MNNRIAIFGILLLSITILYSCTEEENMTPLECPEIIDWGELTLRENSLDFWPYSDSITHITFVDSSGKEYVGKVYDYSSGLVPDLLLNEFTCIDDTTQFYQYHSDTEIISFRLEFEEIDLALDLSLSTLAYPKRFAGSQIQGLEEDDIYGFYQIDMLSIKLTYPSDSKLRPSYLSFRIDWRLDPVPMHPLPNLPLLEIHGKSFINVYTQKPPIPEGDFRIYYTKENGVVAIESADKSISLSLQ